MSDHRPNLLFIFTDQQWAGALSCEGNAELATPNIDRLAQTGIHFNHAFCAQPLCVPSRTAMMTGLMPHTNGVTTNLAPGNPSFRADVVAGRIPFMGRLFADAGYDTAWFGKWHLPLAADDLESHGFSHVSLQRDWEVPREFSKFADRSNRPFLAVVSLMNPHNICEWARGAFLPDATLPPPPIDLPPLPANFGIAEPEPGWIREFLRRRSAHYIAPGFDETQWRQYRWAYWRLCEEADRQVGNVMSALRVHGFDKSTVVVFASDHGDGVAAHHVCQKQVFYEESARVPLIVRPPHCTAGTNARLTNAGMDILPTLLDYADIAVPRELHGTSLRSAVEGCEATQPQYVVCETDFCPGPERWGASGRMVRTKRYKYTVHDALDKNDITEQFFDIEMDPGEMQNLIGTAAARHQVEHHRSLLAKWQKDTEDHWRPQAP